jgi:hypothetical protein
MVWDILHGARRMSKYLFTSTPTRLSHIRMARDAKCPWREYLTRDEAAELARLDEEIVEMRTTRNHTQVLRLRIIRRATQRASRQALATATASR